ncbi:hypothetical protein [Isoptericola aurantiacus]|uniref:hypothetical protein n=1 Tax=Isoptericola aurantiacus TaxID=3377839 RepID=UPI00383A8A31
MRRTTAILAGVLLAATAACSGGGTTAADDVSAEPTPSASRSGEVPVDPDAGGEPEAEGDEEPAQPPKDAGPEVTIVGLPAGGATSDLVGDGWCGAVSNNATPPAGVWLVVTEIRTIPAGLDTGVACPQQPACLGTTLDDAHTTCVVGLVPPDPTAESVGVDLVVRVGCTVAQDCVDYRDSVSPETWAMPNPDPDAASSTDDAPGDATSGSTDDPGESTDGDDESGDGSGGSDDGGTVGETDDGTDGGSPDTGDDGGTSGSGADDGSGAEDAP